MSRRSRRILTGVFFGAAFLTTVVAAPVLYVSTVLEEEDAFVSLTDQVIDHPDVRSEVATLTTEVTFDALQADEYVAEVLPEQARALAVPLTRIATNQLTDTAFTLLDTPPGVDARQAAAREVHRQFTAETDSLVIDLRALLVRTSREVGGPAVGAGVAKLVADTEQGRIVLVEQGSPEEDLLAAVHAIPELGATLWLIGLLLWGSGILVAPDRRRALVQAGVLGALASVVAIVIVAIALYAVLAVVAEGSAAGEAVAEVITQDFVRQQFGALLLGVGVAVAGLVLGDRPASRALRALPRQLWRRDPARWDTLGSLIGDNPPLARVVVWTFGALVLAGWSNPTPRVVITVIVLTALAHGAVWLMTSESARAQRLRTRWAVPDGHVEPGGARGRRLRTNAIVATLVVLALWPAWSRDVLRTGFVVVAVLLVLIDARAAWRLGHREADDVDDARLGRRAIGWAVAGVAGVALLGALLTDDSAESVASPSGCNGADELCDRRIDEIVFAGSHNAMSSTDLGWQLAMQTGDMVAQLDHGVRALLIDALYWRAEGVLEGGDDQAAQAVIDAALSDDEPRTGTWLCHGFCALGATDLTAGLADVSSWLDANPREVLLIVVQDEISTPDLVAAVEASGLIDHVHDHRPGDPWPTLGELIAADERVLVYGENGGSPDEWFQNVWDTAFTETPFAFGLRSDFSCIANRGSDDNDLFLINHWLTTGIPVQEVAASINSRDAILDRVAECEAERGRRPTVFAVDFVETGDLVATVAELNGVAP